MTEPPVSASDKDAIAELNREHGAIRAALETTEAGELEVTPPEASAPAEVPAPRLKFWQRYRWELEFLAGVSLVAFGVAAAWHR